MPPRLSCCFSWAESSSTTSPESQPPFHLDCFHSVHPSSAWPATPPISSSFPPWPEPSFSCALWTLPVFSLNPPLAFDPRHSTLDHPLAFGLWTLDSCSPLVFSSASPSS